MPREEPATLAVSLGATSPQSGARCRRRQSWETGRGGKKDDEMQERRRREEILLPENSLVCRCEMRCMQRSFIIRRVSQTLTAIVH